jgi:Uncharacterised nucleotidyltransferase
VAPTLKDLSIAETACPEKRLLICCARVNVQPEIANQIRGLASRPLDWDYLFSEAADNSLIPLLHRQLNTVAADTLPPLQMDRLRADALENTARALFLTAELIKIMGAFNAGGVYAIPYKGPVLASQAYGDIALRQFEDLDIIVRQNDLLGANDVMTNLGYRPKFPRLLSADAPPSLVPGDYIYIDDAREIMIELHTERSMRHFPVPPDLDAFTQSLVSVSLSGHEIKTFRAEDALAILCVHGSKHFWERLSWIADISEMVRSHPLLDWNATFRRAESFRAQRMLKVGLALAGDLFGAPLPEEIRAQVMADPVAAELTARIEQNLLRREPQVFRAAERFEFRRRMVPGAFAGWRYAMRLTTAPAEEDWELVRLPRALAPLYVALRPFRLLRKYGGKR